MIAKKNFFSPSIFKLSKGFLFLKKRIGWRFFALFLSANIAILMESIGITLAIPVLFSDQELKIFNYDILSYFKISGSYVLDALIIISFFFILKSFFLFFCFYYKAKVRAEFLRCLRSDIFEGMSRIDEKYRKFYDRGRSIDLVTTQLSGVGKYLDQFVLLITSLFSVFIYFVFAFYLSPTYGLLIVCTSLFAMVIFYLFSRMSQRISSEVVSAQRSFSERLIQFLDNWLLFAITNTSTIPIGGLNRVNEDLEVLEKKRGRWIAGGIYVKEPITLLAILTAFWIETVLFDSESSVLLVATILLYKAVSGFVGSMNAFQVLASVNGPTIAVMEALEEIMIKAERNGDLEMPAFKDSIVFNNVSFGYEPGKPVLRNVCFSLNVGDLVVIDGESGGGKSTLLKMIGLLFEPDDGLILLDGLDSSRVDRKTWRSNIGFVPQKPLLIDGSLRQNLSYGSRNILPEADIFSALKSVGLSEFVESLADGLDTMVLNGGETFSGGQLQRFVIAREILRRPKILMLDEPTSSLDKESEKLVFDAVSEVSRFATVILVTHRRSERVKATRYITVADGTVRHCRDF